MKTSSFKIIYATGTLIAIAEVLLSIIFLGFILSNHSFINIENQVMLRRTITIGVISKYSVFMGLVAGIFGAYALNIRSKVCMKLCIYISSLVCPLFAYFVYYFKSQYTSDFMIIMQNEMYANSIIRLSISAWVPDTPAVDMLKKAEERMRLLCKIYCQFGLANIGLILSLCILLYAARRIKIEKREKIVPAITEQSRVGLNTVSLRQKRVIMEAT